MKKIFNFTYRMFKLPELIHELLHCLPAWYWDLNPRIAPNWYSMKHRRTTDGKNMVILLMPAFVGFLFLPLVWNMVVHKTMFHVAAAIFWVGWQAACASDYYKAGYFLIFKKWHNRKDEQ
jgi:hypothetical protein